MPIISVDAKRLNHLLGAEYDPQVLSDALEEIGCDVEDTIELNRYRCPKCAALVEASLGADTVKLCSVCGYQQEEPFVLVDHLTVIRLDLLAARPDLFDIGGLSRALKGYLGQAKGIVHIPVTPSTMKVKVDPALYQEDSYRPYIQCAILEMPPLDDAELATIMKMQENLHWGVGRARKLSSIGVYDLTTITGDLYYTTMDPVTDTFEPLGKAGEQFSGKDILEKHPKGIAFAQLLINDKRYPVLKDQAQQVLSMPPIINSEATKVKVGSTRLLIDVTGPSQAAVANSLKVMVCALVELGAKVYSVEIEGPQGIERTPQLEPKTITVSLSRAKQWLGLPLDADSLVACFERMRLGVKAVDDQRDLFEVTYPSFRSDVKHMVDLFEDLAIGYGYQNIKPASIPTMTVSRPRPEEALSTSARQVMLGLGYTEIMSLPMTTEEDHFTKFRLAVPERFVRVANPKLKALTVVRTHLMSGLMTALQESKRRPVPIRLFELDNVMRINDAGKNGIEELRNLCFVEMNDKAGYSSARSVLDALIREMGLGQTSYEAIEHPSFIPGRAARVTAGNAVGLIGEIHPEILENFHLEYPVCLVDFSLTSIAFENGEE
jgi:phenylalanyl-tRNA synthetase beta chain